MKISVDSGMLTIWLEGRIDSNNAGATEEKLLKAIGEHSDCSLCFDLGKLTYISSAGLRSLLKCRKRAGKMLPLYNVNDDVFDILTVTGFSDLFDIYRKLRDFSMKQREFLTDSVNGKIYALDDDNMLKVFRSGVPSEEVYQEREYAHAAMVSGIPTAIPFDVVTVGDGFGIVYEAIDMVSVASLVTAEPDTLEERADQFAAFLRELHQTPVKDSGLPNIKDRYRQWLDVASPRLERETQKKIMALVESIPEKDTYVHGEINLSNVMLHRGELFVMDAAGSAYGHPIFDLQGIYAALIKIEQERPLYCSTYFGVSGSNCKRFWECFLKAYMVNKTPAELERLQMLLEQTYTLKQELVSVLQGLG